MGKYFVTPATHRVAGGHFQASFALQRSAHKSHYCRVFRYDQTFNSAVAAYQFALEQGRLETCA